MPRKGKGSKIMRPVLEEKDATDCAICGYPKESKVHNHG